MQGVTMSQQKVAERTNLGAVGAAVEAAPEVAVRLVGALLALAVAAVHVADQGGVTAFTSPDWLGWSYRAIEVGGVATAVALMVPRRARLGWVAGLLLGAGPFVGYVASRTVGVPGDPGDVGNWGDWVGTVALVVEAALVILGIGMLLAQRHRPSSRGEVSEDASDRRRTLVGVRGGRRRTGVTPAPILK
jgi:hypothetical protein